MENEVVRVTAIYSGVPSLEKDKMLYSIAKHIVAGDGVGLTGYDAASRQRYNYWMVDSRAFAETLRRMLLDLRIAGLEVRVEP